MAGFSVDVPIVDAANLFQLSPSALTVSGPMQDLSMQISFYDDFVRNTKMTVSAQPHEGSAVLSDVSLAFEGETVRVTHGYVKLSLPLAKELLRVLTEHVDRAEDMVKKAEAEKS